MILIYSTIESFDKTGYKIIHKVYTII